MKGYISAVLLAALLVGPAQAEEVVKVNAGASIVWFDDDSQPSDVELGGTLGASLSPHIAVVGGAWWGVDKSYLRGTLGPRITVTDPNSKNLSIGLGMEYQASSEPVTRSEEWTATATVGYRPFYDRPRVIVGVQGGYGVETAAASLLLGVRYAIGGSQ